MAASSSCFCRRLRLPATNSCAVLPSAIQQRCCCTFKHSSAFVSVLTSNFLLSSAHHTNFNWNHSARRSAAVSVRAAKMESRQSFVGFKAPHFELPEPLTGKTWKLEDFEDKQGLLVMFICNHCPFVVHLKESLVKFAQEYQPKGLAVVGISSNSIKSHPQDGPSFMAEEAKKYEYPFPYLYDESQEVAKAYGAVCTPDFFLFKKDGKAFELAYRGRFDESRPRSTAPITGRDLRAAADAVLSGQATSSDQKPSIGCSIKWHT